MAKKAAATITLFIQFRLSSTWGRQPPLLNRMATTDWRGLTQRRCLGGTRPHEKSVGMLNFYRTEPVSASSNRVDWYKGNRREVCPVRVPPGCRPEFRPVDFFESVSLQMAKAVWNGQTVAESESFETVEGNIYFPEEAVKREFLRPSSTSSSCPWKGQGAVFHPAGRRSGKSRCGLVLSRSESLRHGP